MSDTIESVYQLAANGDPAAYAWLMGFHHWSHGIDDFVDKPETPREECADLCASSVTLFSHRFFVENVATLAPVVAIAAEQWRSSMLYQGPLVDVLRVAGNQVVLAVAYLRGGQRGMEAVSKRLWPIVYECQLKPEPGPAPAPDRSGGPDAVGKSKDEGRTL